MQFHYQNLHSIISAIKTAHLLTINLNNSVSTNGLQSWSGTAHDGCLRFIRFRSWSFCHWADDINLVGHPKCVALHGDFLRTTALNSIKFTESTLFAVARHAMSFAHLILYLLQNLFEYDAVCIFHFSCSFLKLFLL